MPKPVRNIRGYSPSDIRSLFSKEDKYKIGIRLYAVYQVALGNPSRQLEELYNTSYRQILNWVDRFEKEGIEGLRDKKGRGRKSRLTEQQKQSLKALVLTQEPLEYGYNTATWTGPILIDWIATQWNIRYKKTQIYTILKTLGLSYQKAKGFYLEADPKKQEEFKESLKKNS